VTHGVRLALLALVLAALLLTLSRLDVTAIRRAVAHMSVGWAVLAASVNLLGVAVDASRWRIILSAIRRMPLSSVLQAQLVGITANVIFPFKLGEGARAFALAAREGLPTATVLTTVLLDRVIDAATLPLFVALASALVPLPSSLLRFRRPMVVGVLAAAVALAAARSWFLRRRSRAIDLEHPTGGTLDRIVDGLRVLDHRHRLASTIATALCAWSIRAAIVWCMFRAFSLDLPISAAVGVLALLNVGIALVATPGNVGTFELASAGALALWDVPAETGMSLGVTMHVLEVIPPASLGIVAIVWHRGALWPR
jgi:hypothetical protein